MWTEQIEFRLDLHVVLTMESSPHQQEIIKIPRGRGLTLLLSQLTETSSRYARKISGTTALQEALKEKQQHIEQLLVERDLERAEMAKATSRIAEVEKDLNVLKTQHVQVRTWRRNLRCCKCKRICPPQYVTENESNLLQVRGVLASAQKDKQELANQLEEEKRYAWHHSQTLNLLQIKTCTFDGRTIEVLICKTLVSNLCTITCLSKRINNPNNPKTNIILTSCFGESVRFAPSGVHVWYYTVFQES